MNLHMINLNKNHEKTIENLHQRFLKDLNLNHDVYFKNEVPPQGYIKGRAVHVGHRDPCFSSIYFTENSLMGQNIDEIILHELIHALQLHMDVKYKLSTYSDRKDIDLFFRGGFIYGDRMGDYLSQKSEFEAFVISSYLLYHGKSIVQSLSYQLYNNYGMVKPFLKVMNMTRDQFDDFTFQRLGLVFRRLS